MSSQKPSKTQDALLEPADARAGFTIIEALVSLAVVAICLMAIGSVIATNIRGAGKIAQHLELIETLRRIATALPDRSVLATGTLSGEMDEHAWSVDVQPFPIASIPPDPIPPGTAAADRPPVNWTPQTIVIKVQTPSGSVIQLDTLRLTARAEQ